MDLRFARTLGLENAKKTLSAAWEGSRFHHALLLHGPPGMGQAALALDTAQLLLCESRGRQPCGTCAACVGFRAQSLENLYHLLPLKKGGKEGGEGEGLDAAATDEFIETQKALYQDPYLFTWPEKAGIGILQVRELQKQLLYAPSRGRRRVILIAWLEALRPEAANALLKTLEEPPKDTYFVITSEDRAGLMPTLLSRCQQVPLSPLSDSELTAALKRWTPRLPAGPREALIPLAEGAPGTYLALHENGEARLEAAAQFLTAALELDTGALADYLENSSSFADMESAAQTLEITLRLIRLEQKRRVTEADAAADPTLLAALAPFKKLPHLQPFALYCEETLHAVRNYTKPQNAVFGLFLEYETKALEAGKLP